MAVNKAFSGSFLFSKLPFERLSLARRRLEYGAYWLLGVQRNIPGRCVTDRGPTDSFQFTAVLFPLTTIYSRKWKRKLWCFKVFPRVNSVYLNVESKIYFPTESIHNKLVSVLSTRIYGDSLALQAPNLRNILSVEPLHSLEWIPCINGCLWHCFKI